jgi:hypothetical protein
MARYGSKSVLFLADGYDLLAAKIQAVRVKVVNETEPSDGLGDDWRYHSATGMSRAEIVQEGGFFDTSSGSSHAAYSAGIVTSPQTAHRVAVVGYQGQTIGAQFFGFEGLLQTEYEVLAQVGVLQRANATAVISGRCDQGAILHALTTETADAHTEASSVDNAVDVLQRVVPITSSSVANPSVITTTVPHGLTTGDTVLISGHTGSTPSINGEQTATVTSTTTFTIPVNVTVGGTGGTLTRGKTMNGAAAYLEMTALSLGGHTAAQVTIRDSADDIVFGDLVAFTPRTSTGAERVTVAGAVERYAAVSLDFTGAGSSPSTTYLAGLARF